MHEPLIAIKTAARAAQAQREHAMVLAVASRAYRLAMSLWHRLAWPFAQTGTALPLDL